MNSKINELLRDLRTDNSSGASELIDKSLIIIQKYLESILNERTPIKSEFLELASQIIYSRPSMAPLINTIGFLIGDIQTIDKKHIKERLEHLAKYRNQKMDSLKEYFKTLFEQLYNPGLKIMLISHSSTINTLFSNCKERNIKFYVLESRPLLEGRRTAEYFSKNFRTTLIIDSAMGKVISEIDVVLLGIDSILSDGAIINKIGTHPLAIMAHEYNKEVYAIGDSFKYNLRSHFGQDIKIQMKPLDEVYEIGGKNENLTVKNYYFDKTPSQYITRIVSDLGIHTPSTFLKKVKKSLNIDWIESFI